MASAAAVAGASAASTWRASSSTLVAELVTASSAPSSPHPATYAIDSPLTSRPTLAAAIYAVDDHLGVLSTVFGISDAERVDRLVNQDPQPRVGGLVGVDDDPPGFLVTPPARRSGN